MAARMKRRTITIRLVKSLNSPDPHDPKIPEKSPKLKLTCNSLIAVASEMQEQESVSLSLPGTANRRSSAMSVKLLF